MSLLRSRGRGKDYSLTRGLIETTLRAAYVGDWPARAWSRVTTAVRRVDVSLPAASSLRIGFASDLHLGPTTPPATLQNAFAILRDARLDVLALGGDYVFLDATPTKAQLLARLVSTVPARLKVAVLGNHDLWTAHALIEDALRAVGVRVLVNESVDIDDVSIIGVDDPWTGTLDADAAFTPRAQANEDRDRARTRGPAVTRRPRRRHDLRSHARRSHRIAGWSSDRDGRQARSQTPARCARRRRHTPHRVARRRGHRVADKNVRAAGCGAPNP
jgi:hypothetical protein